MRATRWISALGVALLLCAGGAARAANPVQPESRQPAAEPYDDAAAQLGVSQWGGATRSEAVTHVLYRVTGRRELLTVSLPPTVPPPAAARWFGTVTDALGWNGADLYVNKQPHATMLRAVRGSGGRSVGLGRFQAGLNLETLRTNLGQITTGPVLFVARVRADVSQIQPQPLTSGKSDGETFVFYRLDPGGAPVARPLRLDYGVSPRWLAGMGAALLLWLLFPIGVFFALREHLRGAEHLDATARLGTYRRWQRGVSIACTVGSISTYVVMGVTQVILLGSGLTFIPILLVMLPGSVAGVSARLIGLPLEREAFPHRAHLPWYRMLGTEGFGILLMVGVMALVGYQVNSITSSPGRLNPGSFSLIFLIPFLLVGLVVLSALAVPIGMVLRRRWSAKRGAPVDGVVPPERRHTELPALVAQQLEELVQKLGTPVPAIMVTKTEAPSVMALGSNLFVTQNLVEGLQPDQVAGLIMAAELARPKSKLDKVLSWSWVLTLLPMLALFPLFLSFRSGGTGVSTTTWFLPLMLLMWIPTTLITRYQLRRQEQADVRVAEALSDPRRFIEALRRFEQYQIAAMGGDPTPTRTSIFAQRRTRLQKRLGLD